VSEGIPEITESGITNSAPTIEAIMIPLLSNTSSSHTRGTRILGTVTSPNIVLLSIYRCKG
jgi:hypothetical protein